jgi:hypothetical protein
MVFHALVVAAGHLAFAAVVDGSCQVVAAFGEVGLGFPLPPIGFVVGQAQDVQGLENPPEVGDRLAESGGLAVAGDHAGDLVGGDLTGVDRHRDPTHVLPVRGDLAWYR